MKKLIGSEITDEQFRQVHSRLDVHKEVIGTAIAWLSAELGAHNVTTLLDMIEESQNPFEVSDEQN